MPPPSPPRRVGLFGGSFDPPHVCHLLVAVTALEVGGLDEVWWIPLLQHAFGQKRPEPFADRVEMVHRLIAPYAPRMRVEEIEARRGGTSYTVDTVTALRAIHPEARFRMVVGGDLLAEIERWKDAGELVRMAPLVVVGREGSETPGRAPPPGSLLLPITLPAYGSTAIRARLAAGDRVEGLVPERVREYIEARGLYRGTGAGGDDGRPGARARS